MRFTCSLAAAFLVFASTSVALAQSDCSKIVPPSPWGPNDQTGATNRITPAVTKAAAAEIQEGQVVPMSYPLTDGIPLFGTRFTKSILTATSLAPGAAFGENQLTYMEDTWLSQSHVGTHLDGLGHIGRKDCYFNQIPMGKFINQNNMTKLGLEHIKTFATRGVLVDMVKVFKAAGKFKGNSACKRECLDKGTVITGADIQAGLKMYNVTLREGDVLILHTGWGNLFEQFPAQNATYNSGEPGIGKDAAHWLVGQKIVAVGAPAGAPPVFFLTRAARAARGLGDLRADGARRAARTVNHPVGKPLGRRRSSDRGDRVHKARGALQLLPRRAAASRGPRPLR